ncbi:MAG: U32 family peptidase [Bacteroidaceae bacterium]|nr:U32 family peptidase [Bacteroidaceae bacterium]
MREIELLAPARDAQTAREAILHGADAVYIGAPRFGARAAAGVGVEDIASVCRFAHLYGARVYVALNTILYDSELREAQRLAAQLYEAGADALIVQDMALLRMDLPPIALHASTQTDNRTPEKARELAAAGFSQIVVARELSLPEIAAIHRAVDVPLEAFVHGALCVSYSGRCYASQHCFARSANRGECAQFCRLAFDLRDGRGRAVARGRHLLSLRDMNRTDSVEAMMDAGVSSFKIEGRLKDTAYVKNTVAHYRRVLDAIIARRPTEFRRSSFGESSVSFTPDPARSFNRGFTEYFLHTPSGPMASPESPASRGKRIGRVEAVRRGALEVALDGGETLQAGDGLCYVAADGTLQGFRVNKVEGGRVSPHRLVSPQPGTVLWRNHDAAFERQLSRPTALRTMALRLRLDETADGFSLTATDEAGIRVELCKTLAHTPAETPQREQIARQLSRWGGTAWRVVETDVRTACFIPASVLSAWRRELAERLTAAHEAAYRRPVRTVRAAAPSCQPARIGYEHNVANAEAAAYYKDGGAQTVVPAYELREAPGAVLMTCRYCLRRELGACLREGGAHRLVPPLSLALPDGRAFPLDFDCARCEMRVMVGRKNAKDSSR